jgi:hypothetical protein
MFRSASLYYRRGRDGHPAADLRTPGNLAPLVPFRFAATSTRFDRLQSRPAPTKLIRTSRIARHEVAAGRLRRPVSRFARFPDSGSAYSDGVRLATTPAPSQISSEDGAVRIPAPKRRGAGSGLFLCRKVCRTANLKSAPGMSSLLSWNASLKTQG